MHVWKYNETPHICTNCKKKKFKNPEVLPHTEKDRAYLGRPVSNMNFLIFKICTICAGHKSWCVWGEGGGHQGRVQRLLLVIVKSCEQSECPTTGNWLNKLINDDTPLQWNSMSH
jgi:hypothetical protein